MSARRERKKQRRAEVEANEVRRSGAKRTLHSFAEMGQAVAEERIHRMSDAQRRRIEGSLDAEGVAMFRGIMGLTSKAAAVIKDDESRKATVDPFAIARRVLQHVAQEEFSDALELVRVVAAVPGIVPSVRTPLIRVGTSLSSLARDAAERTMASAKREELLSGIHERLSDVIAIAARTLEGMVEQDFDGVERVEVNLPQEVGEPTHADDVPLVILPDRRLNGATMKVRPLASGVYLVECRMVGIPFKVPEEARLLAANAYALRMFGAQVSPWPLTRPDSDGVWFPLFHQQFVCEMAQFPDQARRYYGDSSSANEAAQVQQEAKLQYLRSQKRQFERDNSALYSDLRGAYDELDDLKNVERAEVAEYLKRSGRLPTANFLFVEAHIRERMASEVAAHGRDVLARNAATRRWRGELERLRAQQGRIIDHRIRINFLKKYLVRLEDAIAEAKRLALNPHHASGDAFVLAATAG